MIPGRGVLAHQVRRSSVGVAWSWEGGEVLETIDLKKQVVGFYRDCLQMAPVVKAHYSLTTPIPLMRKRIRLAFEINRNVTDPMAITKLLSIGRQDYQHSVGHIFTSALYLTGKYFGTDPHFLRAAVDQWQNRELILSRKLSRDKARAIASGEEDFPALPGPIYSADGTMTGYYHPKGDLPPGESLLFARPPPFKDWGDYSLPDPWNPHNSPEGPPDPNLIENSQEAYKVDIARLGPYYRHRIRRLMEHDKKTRNMSEYEYLQYFKENEVHLAANDFELPEYAWAEDRFQRRVKRCQNENQIIFASARADWTAKYKATWKAYNYAASLDYWCMVYKQWVPNYNLDVVKYAVEPQLLEDKWDAFISNTGHYAAWRSEAFAAVMKDSNATPLAVSRADFLSQVKDTASARRPYDHPEFEDKWYTDNGALSLSVLADDLAEGFGVPHHGKPVLQAELSQLKDEIGCAELCEKRFKGEWWNRGQIRLMQAMAKIHEMELVAAMCKAAGVKADEGVEAAKAKIAAHDWGKFSFTEFSHFRYPDNDKRGIHAWAVADPEAQISSERALLNGWIPAFTSIFSYEQTVPVWQQGCSRRSQLNKPAEEGGWTLKTDKVKFWDQVVSV